MDITALSQTELKALAYDQLATIEAAQKNLQAINQQLQKFGQTNEEVVEDVTEEVVEDEK